MRIRVEGDENLLIPSVAYELQNSALPEERWIGSTVEHYRWESLDIFGDRALVEFLGVITTKPDFVARQQVLVESTPDRSYRLGIPNEAFEWGLKFLKEILKEVRVLVCEERARKKTGLVSLSDYKAYPKALGVSLATAIMTKLGVNEPMAIGIATLVLLSLAQATKNAFCTMTDAQVIETLNARKKAR
ncbi:MAG: hypothetical protein HOP18_03685 [Deltaproteobacteria bacterium]|nr:hypothetical protein [Deltaproteobacteria bacterium]